MYQDGLSWPFRSRNWGEVLTSILVFVILLCVTGGPIVFIIFASEDVALLLLAILLLLIFVANYAMTQVCLIAIAPSISHTVAQRYNPVAYFCVVSIASVLFFSVGLIGAGFVGQHMSGIDWVHACLQCLGLIVLSLVLIFPASFPDLGIKVRAPIVGAPTTPPFSPDDPEIVFGMRPENWYDTRPSVQDPMRNRVNTLQVFNISGKTSGILHGIVFFVGYFAEAASIITYLSLLHKGEKLDVWWKIYILVCLIVSIICFLSFCISQGLQLVGVMDVPKQLQLCFEVFAIFMMIMGVIVLSLAEGNLVHGFGSIVE
jgi:hypothetical protein